ncbi:MAG: hypothetical protein H6745_33600 [Deltaproteobacteria bacterium]|nr:hypothetical protein [Deltaproteobacteria bacterium]
MRADVLTLCLAAAALAACAHTQPAPGPLADAGLRDLAPFAGVTGRVIDHAGARWLALAHDGQETPVMPLPAASGAAAGPCVDVPDGDALSFTGADGARWVLWLGADVPELYEVDGACFRRRPYGAELVGERRPDALAVTFPGGELDGRGEFGAAPGDDAAVAEVRATWVFYPAGDKGKAVALAPRDPGAGSPADATLTLAPGEEAKLVVVAGVRVVLGEKALTVADAAGRLRYVAVWPPLGAGARRTLSARVRDAGEVLRVVVTRTERTPQDGDPCRGVESVSEIVALVSHPALDVVRLGESGSARSDAPLCAP